MKRINNIHSLRSRRRELRQNSTPQEKILWWHIKNNQIGFKFKRQHSLGGYIADFYCAEKKFVVEIDGSVHSKPDSKKYDQLRNSTLEEYGCTIIRFKNSEIDNDVFKVITNIKLILSKL